MIAVIQTCLPRHGIFLYSIPRLKFRYLHTFSLWVFFFLQLNGGDDVVVVDIDGGLYGRERKRLRKITVPANAHNGLNSHKHCLVFQYGSTNENDKYRRGIFFFESFLIYRVFVVVGCATVAATMCFFYSLFYTLRMAIIL